MTDVPADSPLVQLDGHDSPFLFRGVEQLIEDETSPCKINFNENLDIDELIYQYKNNDDINNQHKNNQFKNINTQNKNENLDIEISKNPYKNETNTQNKYEKLDLDNPNNQNKNDKSNGLQAMLK